MKFALFNNKLIHISNVTKTDNCICPNCGRPLIKYQDHFQHKGSTCNSTDSDNITRLIIAKLINDKNKFQIKRYEHSKSESLADYNIKQVKTYKTTLGTVHPNLIIFNDNFRFFIYISKKGERKDKAELPLYKEETDYRIFVIKVKDFISNPKNLHLWLQANLWGYNQTNNSQYITEENIQNIYGLCGNCNEPLELCINTYDDSSKPLKGTGISTIYARDDKNEDKDKQASYLLGSLLLRCPKCHRVMTVCCPACLKKGKLQDMKVMINNKKKHIFTCCTKYVSGRDAYVTPEMLDTQCDTSLILYSDVEGKVISEEHKRVGGFFNWLTDFDNADNRR